jgi:hypothetical protein
MQALLALSREDCQHLMVAKGYVKVRVTAAQEAADDRRF